MTRIKYVPGATGFPAESRRSHSAETTFPVPESSPGAKIYYPHGYRGGGTMGE